VPTETKSIIPTLMCTVLPFTCKTVFSTTRL